MVSTKISPAEASRYHKLSSDDNHEIDLQAQDTQQDTQQDTDALNSIFSPPIVRRRHPNPRSPTHSAVSAMSFVGLKRLFFQQTLTPVPSRKSNRDFGMKNGSLNFSGPFYWSQGTREP